MLSRLWQKLFLAFALLSVAALLALYFLQQRAFQRDFLDYTNRVSIGRLEAGAVQIGRRYAEVGDWSFLHRQPRVFENLLDGGSGRLREGPGLGAGPREDARDGPREGRPARDIRDMKPGEGRPREPGAYPPLDRRDPPPPRDGEPEGRMPYEKSPPRKKIDPLNFNTRVSLIAADGRHVIGNPAVPLDSPSIAVKSGGEVIGKLLLAPSPALQSDADLAFAAAQTRHALTAAIGVLIGALLLAWILARWLLKPVKALGAASNRLAAGEYEVRIDVDRRDELGDLARDFNRLAGALERNRQARRDWGADIAHELRTPLSILRGEIQALQDGVRPLNGGALSSLQAECARLTALVEDLYQLSLSDIGALEYHFAPLNLAALIERIAGEHRVALEQAGIALALSLPSRPAFVRADELRLSQLFVNLLTNTRRYTDSPGKVSMALSEDAGSVRVTIDDTPPGVAAELLPRLFDRLFRVEGSRARAAGGAGLGLAICKNIVDAHGGIIAAEHSPLGGLRITIELPLLKGAS